MKSNQRMATCFSVTLLALTALNCFLVSRIVSLENKLTELTVVSETDKAIIARGGPTSEQASTYMETHNGSAPPAIWYPKGDPWRGIPAKEANRMFGE